MEKNNLFLTNVSDVNAISFEIIKIFKKLFYIAFSFGFLIIGSYLFSIKFMPTKGLISFAYIILSAAFSGIFFLFVIIGIFIVSPLIWEQLLFANSTCRIIIGKYFKDTKQISEDKFFPEFKKLRLKIVGFYFLSIIV